MMTFAWRRKVVNALDSKGILQTPVSVSSWSANPQARYRYIDML